VFALTWRRYLRSPLGNHRCPQCAQPSRLKHSATYNVAILVTIMILAAGAFIPTFYMATSIFPSLPKEYNWLIVYVAVLLFVILDKYFEGRFSRLVKREEKKKHAIPNF
jgi:hypothetical protein